MTNYRRNFIAGGSYFFTVALADRSSSLLADHIDSLRAVMRTVKTVLPFRIEAMAVLPEHLHCIWTLPPGDSDYSTRWKKIKAVFSRTLPARGERSGSAVSKGERGVWQRRYWEHTLRDEDDWRRHIDYIHYNPVKHGYVARVADWPYSTFRRCVRFGIYAIDWAGTQTEGVDGFGE